MNMYTKNQMCTTKVKTYVKHDVPQQQKVSSRRCMNHQRQTSDPLCLDTDRKVKE